MKSNLFITIFISGMIIFSCKNETTETPVNDSGLIEITKTQFESENMEFGEPILYHMADLVHFTGVVIPSVNGRVQISLPIPGLISKIYCKPAEIVKKGDFLFEVAGNEFIDMQKDFAESAAMLNRLKSDYDRVKELTDESIATKKDYVLAESTYNAEKARYMFIPD